MPSRLKIRMNYYNHFRSILRLFYVLPKLPLTTSETMCDYYLHVAEGLRTLIILRN